MRKIQQLILLFAIITSCTAFSQKQQGKEIYSLIQKNIQQYNKKPSKIKLISILKNYSKLYKFDTSYYSYDLIYPIYLKDKNSFKQLLEKELSITERKIILFNLEGYKNELKHGNDF
jgi:hypothetical protein